MHARSLPNWVGILAYENPEVLASSFDQTKYYKEDSVSFEFADAYHIVTLKNDCI